MPSMLVPIRWDTVETDILRTILRSRNTAGKNVPVRTENILGATEQCIPYNAIK